MGAPVSSSIISSVSPSTPLNLISNNAIGVSSNIPNLTSLSPISEASSLLGNTNLPGSLIETSSFDQIDTSESLIESEAAIDDGQIEYNQIENEDQDQPTDSSNQQSDDTEAPDEFISATSENDNLLGGQGTTEFLFNVGDVYGGSDIVTDTGTNTDDRIYIQKLLNNDVLLISRNQANTDIQVELFEYQSSVSNYSSLNTISTLIATDNSGVGVEELHLSPYDNEYNELM